jgi:hypothetical protein
MSESSFAEARNNLGCAPDIKGFYDAAIVEISEATRLKPVSPRVTTT